MFERKVRPKFLASKKQASQNPSVFHAFTFYLFLSLREIYHTLFMGLDDGSMNMGRPAVAHYSNMKNDTS